MPNPKFKVGDTVKCVDPNLHTKKMGAPVLGGIYVVSHVSFGPDEGLIKVVGCDEPFWNTRFELVEWIPKIGDLVNASKWPTWPQPNGEAINKPIKQIADFANYSLPDAPTVALHMIENENGMYQWWPIEALTRADGTQPTVPQLKKRIYNA